MTLKDQIADEIVHGKQISNHNIVACRSCGYSYVYKGRQGDLNGNFCSLRCQAWYDDGNPQLPSDLAAEALKVPVDKWKVVAGPGVEAGEPYYPAVFPAGHKFTPMRMGPKGWYIHCYNCNQEFESLGMRCCSRECEERYREHEDNIKLMAEAGMEPSTAKRKCEVCSAHIPTWRNGKKIRSDVRFCSPRCAQRAKRSVSADARSV